MRCWLSLPCLTEFLSQPAVIHDKPQGTFIFAMVSISGTSWLTAQWSAYVLVCFVTY